eukprot:5343931-Prymnesium_polylepis.1
MHCETVRRRVKAHGTAGPARGVGAGGSVAAALRAAAAAVPRCRGTQHVQSAQAGFGSVRAARITHLDAERDDASNEAAVAPLAARHRLEKLADSYDER